METNEPKKILIVEDNEMNRELVSDILEARGHKIIQASSGNEALEMARSEQPHVILMDIQLPGMDGLEVTRTLKEDPRTRDIAIVALTAYAMRNDEARAREAGCSGYIAKPINTREFAQVVESYFVSTDHGAEH